MWEGHRTELRAEWCCDHEDSVRASTGSSAPALSTCFLQQPPVPGMEESMSYQAPPQQLPAAQPPQPSNPPHGAHALNSGPQPGTAPATQHSQAGPASGQAYGPHAYSEPAKPKKGQQLWNRMKRKLEVEFGEREGIGAAPYRAKRGALLGVVLIPWLWMQLVWSPSLELGVSHSWRSGNLRKATVRSNPSSCGPHSSPGDWWSQVQHSETALCCHQSELQLHLGGPAQQLRPPAQP